MGIIVGIEKKEYCINSEGRVTIGFKEYGAGTWFNEHDIQRNEYKELDQSLINEFDLKYFCNFKPSSFKPSLITYSSGKGDGLMEFKEGDQVEIVNKSGHIPHRFKIGDEGEVIGKMGNNASYNIYRVRVDDTIQNVLGSNLELISRKGSDDTVELLEAEGIAFKVDNFNLLKALTNEMEEIGVRISKNVYKEKTNGEPKPNLGGYFGMTRADLKSSSCLRPELSSLGSKRFAKSKCDRILEFPEGWDKIIKWYKHQQISNPPEIKGYEAEIDGKEVSVGCVDMTVGSLVQFSKLLRELEVESGDVSIGGEQLTLSQIDQFIQNVREYTNF